MHCLFATGSPLWVLLWGHFSCFAGACDQGGKCTRYHLGMQTAVVPESKDGAQAPHSNKKAHQEAVMLALLGRGGRFTSTHAEVGTGRPGA